MSTTQDPRLFQDQVDADTEAGTFIAAQAMRFRDGPVEVRCQDFEQSDGRVMTLWSGGKLVACATVVRTDSNFSALVTWPEAAAALREPRAPTVEPDIEAIARAMWEAGEKRAFQYGKAFAEPWIAKSPVAEDYRAMARAVAALYRGAPPETLTAEPDGWRPIETAPRDGTDVLVWTPGYDCNVAFWGTDDWQSGHWFTSGGHDGTSMTPGQGPSHWMPLPEGPSVGARGAPERGTEP